MASIAAKHDLELKQYDTVNAFPHAKLGDQDQVIMKMPEGHQKAGYVLLIKKVLYGLRKSLKLWYKDLIKSLKELGFEQIPEESYY